MADCDGAAYCDGCGTDDGERFTDTATDDQADRRSGEADSAGDQVDAGAHLGTEERGGGRGRIGGGLGDCRGGQVRGDDGGGVSDGGLLLGGGWLLAALALELVHRVGGNVVLLAVVHRSLFSRRFSALSQAGRRISSSIQRFVRVMTAVSIPGSEYSPVACSKYGEPRS